MIDLLSTSVALPLVGAVLAAALPGRASWTGLAGALATTVTALALAFQVWAGGEQRLELGGWGVPLGIALQADGLSAALLAMANLVALAISLYALGYFAKGGLARYSGPFGCCSGPRSTGSSWPPTCSTSTSRWSCSGSAPPP